MGQCVVRGEGLDKEIDNEARAQTDCPRSAKPQVDQDSNNEEARHAAFGKIKYFDDEELLALAKVEISRINGDCGTDRPK